MKVAAIILCALFGLAGCATSSSKGVVTPYAHKVSALQIAYMSRLPSPISVKSYTPSIDMMDMEQRARKASDAFEMRVRELVPALAQRDGIFKKLSFAAAAQWMQRGEEKLDRIGYTEDDVLVIYPASAELWCQTNLLFETACSTHLTMTTILYDARAKREMWRMSHFVRAGADEATARNAVYSVWKNTVAQLRAQGLVRPADLIEQ